MTCDKALDLISARLDGELSPQEESALTAHLQACPACRAINNEMEFLHVALTQTGEVDAPSALSGNVMQKIKAERLASRRRFVRRISGLAACLVLCLGVWRLNLSNPGQPGSDVPDLARHVQPPTSTGELSFSNEQHLQLSGMATSFAPSADLLCDEEGFSRFLARFPYNDLSSAAQTYDEEYFRTHRLLAVAIYEPSSSITHSIAQLTEHTVTLLRHVPEAGDSDVALWLILAEVDGTGPQTPLSVELLSN